MVYCCILYLVNSCNKKNDMFNLTNPNGSRYTLGFRWICILHTYHCIYTWNPGTWPDDLGSKFRSLFSNGWSPTIEVSYFDIWNTDTYIHVQCVYIYIHIFIAIDIDICNRPSENPTEIHPKVVMFIKCGCFAISMEDIIQQGFHFCYC